MRYYTSIANLIPFILILAFIIACVFYVSKNKPDPPLETKFYQNTNITEFEDEISEDGLLPKDKLPAETTVVIKQPGTSALIDNPNHVYQTFNNCGPATLTMILNWHGSAVNQTELGNSMRPYQVASGDNDDKTIFTYEFVEWAKKYGYDAVGRINGDIDLLKAFTANGIPVVVKTWLNVNDDVGHFRLIRGYDDQAQVIIQDDSYHGPNKKISYYDFLSMWQPFNYDYIIVYTSEQKELVETIIGDELNENTAWENALTRAKAENELAPENIYPVFNMSTSYYHLGNYENSIREFEKVQNRLPRRMLWYQIEPILAYKELGKYDKVFEISQSILDNGNRAFSELYQLRGEVYLDRGNITEAKKQFELAILYNKNYEPAKKALEELE